MTTATTHVEYDGQPVEMGEGLLFSGKPEELVPIRNALMEAGYAVGPIKTSMTVPGYLDSSEVEHVCEIALDIIEAQDEYRDTWRFAQIVGDIKAAQQYRAVTE